MGGGEEGGRRQWAAGTGRQVARGDQAMEIVTDVVKEFDAAVFNTLRSNEPRALGKQLLPLLDSFDCNGR